MNRKRIPTHRGMPGRGPFPCPAPGCGLVYTPGYWREHVRDYHKSQPCESIAREAGAGR